MDGVNGLDAGVLLSPPLKPPAKELDNDTGPSTNVDYHLNNLLASHLSSAGLTPQEIADASRTTAAAAALAAKAARATADEKAIAAAKAVAAAKSALALVASFPKTNQAVVQDPYLVAADDLFCSKDTQLPSNLQLGDVSQAIMPHSSSSCERQNDQREVATGLGERPNPEPAISKTVDFSGLGTEVGCDKLNGSAGGEGAKEGTQVTRKRGRPKSK